MVFKDDLSCLWGLFDGYDNPEPIRKKRTVDKSLSKLNGHIEFINELIETDKTVHKKQRHTKLKIYKRLKEERGYTGSYTTVRNYVSSIVGNKKEMYVPLCHIPITHHFAKP